MRDFIYDFGEHLKYCSLISSTKRFGPILIIFCLNKINRSCHFIFRNSWVWGIELALCAVNRIVLTTEGKKSVIDSYPAYCNVRFCSVKFVFSISFQACTSINDTKSGDCHLATPMIPAIADLSLVNGKVTQCDLSAQRSFPVTRP